MEQVDFEQIKLCLESVSFTSKYRSGFPCPHLTEMFFVNFCSDLFCYLDESLALVYIVLDSSAAFDIIDHQFLFDISAKRIGLKSVLLLLIKNSYSKSLK